MASFSDILENVQGALGSVNNIVGQSVDTWDSVFGGSKAEESPQPNPPAEQKETTNDNVGGSDKDMSQLLLIGGAVVLLFVLLK